MKLHKCLKQLLCCVLSGAAVAALAVPAMPQAEAADKLKMHKYDADHYSSQTADVFLPNGSTTDYDYPEGHPVSYKQCKRNPDYVTVSGKNVTITVPSGATAILEADEEYHLLGNNRNELEKLVVEKDATLIIRGIFRCDAEMVIYGTVIVEDGGLLSPSGDGQEGLVSSTDWRVYQDYGAYEINGGDLVVMEGGVVVTNSRGTDDYGYGFWFRNGGRILNNGCVYYASAWIDATVEDDADIRGPGYDSCTGGIYNLNGGYMSQGSGMWRATSSGRSNQFLDFWVLMHSTTDYRVKMGTYTKKKVDYDVYYYEMDGETVYFTIDDNKKVIVGKPSEFTPSPSDRDVSLMFYQWGIGPDGKYTNYWLKSPKSEIQRYDMDNSKWEDGILYAEWSSGFGSTYGNRWTPDFARTYSGEKYIDIATRFYNGYYNDKETGATATLNVYPKGSIKNFEELTPGP